MDIKVIKTRTEYESALERLVELMDKNLPIGSKEENFLELLLIVIRDYEQKIIEPLDLDPIASIKFRMDQMQMLRKELVPYLGSMSKVSEILSGKRNLSLSMIRKLHEGLGIPFESLLTKRRVRKPVRRKRVQQHRKRVLWGRKRRKLV